MQEQTPQSAPSAPPSFPKNGGNVVHLGESHVRTIAKSISYRVMGLVLTTGVAWLITKRMDVAASVGMADAALKVAAFYIHERMWLRVSFGRTPPPEYEI